MLELHYLVSAWAGVVRDEHQLLGDALGCLVQASALPPEHLAVPLPSGVQLTVQPYDNSRAKDVWTTVGGAIKPSFELVVTSAADAPAFADLPPRVERIRALVGRMPGPGPEPVPGHGPQARAGREAGARRDRTGLTVRVSTGSTLVDLAPGSTADVDVDVVNTGSVIDGITARVIGLDGGHVTTHPPVLALFPDSAGRLTVSLGLPPPTRPDGTR